MQVRCLTSVSQIEANPKRRPRYYTLIGPGMPETAIADENAPALYLHYGQSFAHNGNARKGKFWIVAAPCPPKSTPDSNGYTEDWRRHGYMTSGDFVYCSDSRFPAVGPIPIHDAKAFLPET